MVDPRHSVEVERSLYSVSLARNEHHAAAEACHEEVGRHFLGCPRLGVLGRGVDWVIYRY